MTWRAGVRARASEKGRGWAIRPPPRCQSSREAHWGARRARDQATMGVKAAELIRRAVGSHHAGHCKCAAQGIVVVVAVACSLARHIVTPAGGLLSAGSVVTGKARRPGLIIDWPRSCVGWYPCSWRASGTDASQQAEGGQTRGADTWRREGFPSQFKVKVCSSEDFGTVSDPNTLRCPGAGKGGRSGLDGFGAGFWYAEGKLILEGFDSSLKGGGTGAFEQSGIFLFDVHRRLAPSPSLPSGSSSQARPKCRTAA